MDVAAPGAIGNVQQKRSERVADLRGIGRICGLLCRKAHIGGLMVRREIGRVQPSAESERMLSDDLGNTAAELVNIVEIGIGLIQFAPEK